MGVRGSSNPGGRSRVLTGLAVLAMGALAWTVTATLGGDDSSDEPEPCLATVYEGCPGRWDYLTTG